MFRYGSATVESPNPDINVWSRRTRSRIVVEEMSTEEDETDENSFVEDIDKDKQEMEEEETSMNCSLLRSCDRCTETEFSSIPECQKGNGRIVTFRCTAATTPTDEMTETDVNGDAGSSSSTPNNNNDRDTRSYQEYRKDDLYYGRNSKNDSLAMLDALSSTTATSSSSLPFLYHYESCYHTKDEYEFNYVQFQVFICLLGIVSIYSIRKQKMFAASLFDQRRMKTTGTSAVTSTRSTTRNSSGRGVVIQRSNTGLMSHSNPSNNSSNANNNDNSNGNNASSIEMKALLSSGSSNGDMDIV